MNKVIIAAVIAVLCLITLSSAHQEKTVIEGTEYVITPHGLRLPQCVLEVPHNATVTTAGDKKLSIKVGEGAEMVEKFYEVPEECHNDVLRVSEKLQAKYLQRKQQQQQRLNESFPLNGWLDYTGWYPPASQSHLEKFSSTYTTPNNPRVTSSQVLFYFIGMQDNDSPLVNIVQPVLTWGNGVQNWYVKSWICCPNNITVSSPPINGLHPGARMNGYVQRVSADVWRVDSEFNGQHTTLNGQVGAMNYNWADVTLEVYNIAQCGDFASGNFVAGDLALFDQQNQRLNPQWSYTAPSPCGGRIYAQNSQTMIITHTN